LETLRIDDSCAGCIREEDVAAFRFEKMDLEVSRPSREFVSLAPGDGSGLPKVGDLGDVMTTMFSLSFDFLLEAGCVCSGIRLEYVYSFLLSLLDLFSDCWRIESYVIASSVADSLTRSTEASYDAGMVKESRAVFGFTMMIEMADPQSKMQIWFLLPRQAN
jgi:hypothetical protein